MSNESKAFEDNVRELLRLAGYAVLGETLIGHKRVDIYAEERRFGVVRRIAVECKKYGKAMTQDEVNNVLSDYRTLYDANRIDEVLLVTDNGLTPSASAFVRDSRTASHLTFTELQANLVDFVSYLSTLCQNVEEDELRSYYVRPRTEEGDLQEYVESWIRAGAGPLAILGGYGMGKTTFVRHMAATLAATARADSSARIPIVIRLPEISSEQSLEGLLGRVLASSALIRNYNFDVFMALNTNGRFVIFLDGFDEMKHTLTWEQFKYNFRQLNRLVADNSRVILLGRPTAFMSDEEHSYALHGNRVIEGFTVKEPDWPNYEERRIQPFTPRQIERFVRDYSAYLNRRKLLQFAIDPGLTLKRMRGASSSDLASRPVQLRILAEVLPQWNDEATALTLGRLYSTFVDIVIDREQEKIARRRFNRAERRSFARRLAYWLWTSSRSQRAIQANEIPASLFPTPRIGETAEGIRRDLVSACFLERKFGDSLYFAHRSFQEFLVAEHLIGTLGKSIEHAGKSNDAVGRMASAVTPDVAGFIASLATTSDCKRFDQEVAAYRGRLGRSVLLAWTHDHDYLSFVWAAVRERRHGSWQAFLLTLAALDDRPGISPTQLTDAFIESLAEVRTSTDRIAQMLCIMALTSKIERKNFGEGGRRVWRMCKEINQLISQPRGSASLSVEREFLQQSSVTFASTPGIANCTWQVGAVLKTMVTHLRAYAVVQEWLTELSGDQTVTTTDFARSFAFMDRTIKLKPADVIQTYDFLRRLPATGA